MVSHFQFIHLAIFLSVSTAAQAASPNIAVLISGAQQGKFKGTSSGKTDDGRINAIAFTYDDSVPLDMSSGQASGKRSAKPLTITKLVDASSPQLFQAISTGEVLTTVELDLARAGGVYEVIKLSNARIFDIHQYSPVGNTQPTALEDVSLTFQKIEISSRDSHLTFSDDWQTPEAPKPTLSPAPVGAVEESSRQ